MAKESGDEVVLLLRANQRGDDEVVRTHHLVFLLCTKASWLAENQHRQARARAISRGSVYASTAICITGSRCSVAGKWLCKDEGMFTALSRMEDRDAIIIEADLIFENRGVHAAA